MSWKKRISGLVYKIEFTLRKRRKRSGAISRGRPKKGDIYRQNNCGGRTIDRIDSIQNLKNGHTT